MNLLPTDSSTRHSIRHGHHHLFHPIALHIGRLLCSHSEAIAAGAPIQQAAELANVAAGIVVGKVGTAVAYASELVQSLHRHDLLRAESKILALEPACDRIAAWRQQGMKMPEAPIPLSS